MVYDRQVLERPGIQYCVEIDHTDPTILFDFFGSGLQRISDESWGIDNVEVFLA